jgi:hypothetical protein
MAKTLPYRAVTTSGAVIECEFALHPETTSATDIGEMVSRVLGALDMRIEGDTKHPVANGDVLQALAIALALRAEMLPTGHAMKTQLVEDVVARAMTSSKSARYGRSPVGHG